MLGWWSRSISTNTDLDEDEFIIIPLITSTSSVDSTPCPVAITTSRSPSPVRSDLAESSDSPLISTATPILELPSPIPGVTIASIPPTTSPEYYYPYEWLDDWTPTSQEEVSTSNLLERLRNTIPYYPPENDSEIPWCDDSDVTDRSYLLTTYNSLLDERSNDSELFYQHLSTVSDQIATTIQQETALFASILTESYYEFVQALESDLACLTRWGHRLCSR